MVGKDRFEGEVINENATKILRLETTRNSRELDYITHLTLM